MRFSRSILIAAVLLVLIGVSFVMTSDSDASVTRTYGSDDVGADRIVFDANGGTGGFAQYVLNGNPVHFPTEYKADSQYPNEYTRIHKDGHVLLGWSESRTAVSPSYYPGKEYAVLSDRTFYAVWGDLTYDSMERFGGMSDDDICEAQHTVVTKGSVPGLVIDDGTGAYALMRASIDRGTVKYVLSVEHDGSMISSETTVTGTAISADWITLDISRSGELSFFGRPADVGVYTITVHFMTKGMSGSYGDLEDLYCRWQVSVADTSYDPSVMMHVTYNGEAVGYGPYHTAIKLPDSVSDRQKGWNIAVDQSFAVFPVGGSYSVVRGETVLSVSEYTYEEISQSGVVGVIAYNANGGSYNGAFAELAPVEGYHGLRSGSVVTKQGSAFLGWNSSGSMSDPIYPEGYLYDIYAQYTELKAVWGPASSSFFDVYLVNPGDGSADASFRAVSGCSYALPVHGFELSGYDFLGWSSVRNDVGEGEPSEGDTVRPARSTTYYTVYKPKEYSFTVHYDPGAGTGSMDDQTETSRQAPFSITLLPSTFTAPEGYSFVGWATSRYAGSPSFYPGDYYQVTGTGETTLYAIYSLVPSPVPADVYRFSLQFSGNGTDVTNIPGRIDRTLSIDECALYVPDTVPSRTDHRFLGWAESPAGLAKYEPGDRVIIKAGEGRTDAVLILYAIWQSSTQGGDGTEVTVRFVGEGGTISTVTVRSGQAVAPIFAPVREGQAFLGWYYGQARWDFTQSVTGDMTLNAIYRTVFDLEIHDDSVTVLLRCTSSSTKVTFSDGFQETYSTSSIPAHSVKAGNGSVTVRVVTEDGTFTAMRIFTIEDSIDDEPENEDHPDTKLIVGGVAGALAVLGLLYWRFRL